MQAGNTNVDFSVKCQLIDFKNCSAPARLRLSSPRERSLGRSIARNLRAGGFGGSLHIVNPNYECIDGLSTVNSVEAISEVPDIVVIAAPPAAVPEIVAAAGTKGAAAAIIITAGLSHGTDSFADAAKQAARTHGLRLVGPNCLGVTVPSARFNASFAAHMPPAGDLALISQSGAIVAGMAEWGTQHSIGFSALVSIGDQVDVDFGDLLDFFAMD
jgi:acetyltransferase